MGPFTRRWYSHIRFRRFRLRLLTALAKSVIIEFVKWLRHHIPALRGGETSSNMRLSPSIVGPLDAASPVHRTTHHCWPFDQDLYADVAVFLLCGVSILISSAFSARIVLRVKKQESTDVVDVVRGAVIEFRLCPSILFVYPKDSKSRGLGIP